jgi:hypothetical protein
MNDRGKYCCKVGHGEGKGDFGRYWIVESEEAKNIGH